MATIGSIASVRPVFAKQAPESLGALRLWLTSMAALVFAMVVVGGATRLTGSGLSITEWQPLVGTLPPLSDAAWLEAFHKYQQIPQYQTLNKGMSLGAFKGIFWWEWSHRQLGRVIGLAFLIPFLFFLVRGRVKGVLAWNLGGLFALGGLQGALGWYMVASGLSVRTDVSQYRLAAHLLLASALFAALIWTALDVARGSHRHIHLKTLATGSTVWAAVVLLAIFFQIGAGALVAGLKAGLAYNTWPLMDGHLVPSDLLILHPTWVNLFENSATVQFDHRMFAYALTALIVWHVIRVVRSADDDRQRTSAVCLIAILVAQVALGIWTLVSQVPLSLALAHQATAMMLLATSVWHLYTLVRE